MPEITGLENDSSFSRKDFGEDFHWGVSTAAYQIEGAHNADGKGPSIWDDFTKRKGKVYKNQNGDIACDFYHLYPQDIGLIRELGIANFRFSLSWPRILPEGVGKINQKGLDFYHRVIDRCLENGVTPWITLYHWDLPLNLEEKGGWTNRDITYWFTDYTEVVGKAFGDRVKHWMVLNEPMVFTGAGYFLGIHAPGKKWLKNFLQSAHHATLCQALGGRKLKDLWPDAEVGTTFSCSHIEPYSQKDSHRRAARKVDALLNRLFLEPSLGLGYPLDDLKGLKRIEKYQKTGDDKLATFDFDFIGVQNYTREIVRYSFLTPLIQARLIKASKRNVPVTLMDWEVYPPSIYYMLKKFNAYKKIKKLIITENGAAFHDEQQEGVIKDPRRVMYLRDHLGQVLKAKNEGVKVKGYFVWTLMDNFEWAEGFYPRFGIVYVDFKTQRRLLKSSGLWYKKFLAEA